MTFDEYQKFTDTTRVVSTDLKFVYTALGLSGESGEVAEKIKKIIRDHDGKITEEMRSAIAKELGDVLWYVAQLSRDCGLSLEEVVNMNVQKLQSRRERDKIHGSGDDR